MNAPKPIWLDNFFLVLGAGLAALIAHTLVLLATVGLISLTYNHVAPRAT